MRFRPFAERLTPAITVFEPRSAAEQLDRRFPPDEFRPLAIQLDRVLSLERSPADSLEELRLPAEAVDPYLDEEQRNETRIGSEIGKHHTTAQQRLAAAVRGTAPT